MLKNDETGHAFETGHAPSLRDFYINEILENV